MFSLITKFEQKRIYQTRESPVGYHFLSIKNHVGSMSLFDFVSFIAL